MNTKTMRLPPRRALTSNNKRKDREGFDFLKPSSPPPPPPPPAPPLCKFPNPILPIVGSAKFSEPDSVAYSSNQLLAGYLAHEFLTKGTLFGQQWDPDRAESGSSGVESSNDIYNNNKKKIKPSREGKESEPSKEKENYQKYVEVSSLLKGGEGGAHLPGVFNPSQLARFLQT